MKLDRLFNSSKVLNEYLDKLRGLSRGKLLTESVNEDIIDKAFKAGEFGNPEWLRQLMNGLKQVGVHGLNIIPEDERPVTVKEMRKVIGLLLNMVERR